MTLVAEKELLPDAKKLSAMAVRRSTHVEKVQNDLGVKARYRSIECAAQTSVLREPSAPYAGDFAGENDALRSDNTV